MRVLYVYIGLFIIGCSPKKPTEVKETEQELVTERKVFFKWPKNGATVASPVFIAVSYTHLTLPTICSV